jgi:hypothetical protein
MNADEATRKTQEVVAAKENHRLMVLVPQQIEAVKQGIAHAVAGGSEYYNHSKQLEVEVARHFEAIGYFVDYSTVVWGEWGKHRKKLADKEEAQRKAISERKLTEERRASAFQRWIGR